MHASVLFLEREDHKKHLEKHNKEEFHQIQDWESHKSWKVSLQWRDLYCQVVKYVNICLDKICTKISVFQRLNISSKNPLFIKPSKISEPGSETSVKDVSVRTIPVWNSFPVPRPWLIIDCWVLWTSSGWVILTWAQSPHTTLSPWSQERRGL